MAAVAQAERKAISKRTIEALAAAKVRGTKLGGARGNAADLRKGPVASAAVRSKTAKDRAAKVMQQIQVLRVRSATSLREIAEGLNGAGITTPRGSKWNASQVKRVLDNAPTA